MYILDTYDAIYPIFRLGERKERNYRDYRNIFVAKVNNIFDF